MEGGRDSDRQDKAFALKAKGPTEKDAWSKPEADNWIAYYIIKDEQCIWKTIKRLEDHSRGLIGTTGWQEVHHLIPSWSLSQTEEVVETLAGFKVLVIIHYQCIKALGWRKNPLKHIAVVICRHTACTRWYVFMYLTCLSLNITCVWIFSAHRSNFPEMFVVEK